jgi:hypothetical protein
LLSFRRNWSLRHNCHNYFWLFRLQSVVLFPVISAVVFEASGKVVLFMFPKWLEDLVQHVEDDDGEADKTETEHDVLTHFIILSKKHQGSNILGRSSCCS